MTTTDHHPAEAGLPVSPLLPAQTGRLLVDGPLGAVLLADASATGGAASFVLHPLAPRALGSPVHTHSREDEWTFVLGGHVGVEVGDRVVLAAPGDMVLKPRGVPHAFWNPTDEPARLLDVITPGGFETYFEGLGEILAAPEPDLARLGELAARHGVRMDPASVPRLIAEHDLRVDEPS
jgi:mannose-6-phosphate isomerase-like protein (cupin superfamily)